MKTGEKISIRINGQKTECLSGLSVAAVLLNCGIEGFRTSVSGEGRAPVCGMGVCFECRLEIDGRREVRSCQVLVVEGMEIFTDDGR
ncbi:MAG: (2Fe-2S)-binding protein [Pyrinomonadaceae bacterium]